MLESCKTKELFEDENVFGIWFISRAEPENLRVTFHGNIKVGLQNASSLCWESFGTQ